MQHHTGATGQLNPFLQLAVIVKQPLHATKESPGAAGRSLGALPHAL